MKRLITSMTVLLLCLGLSAQTLEDYNKNQTHTVEYDDYFNPTLVLTLTNVATAKTVTSIEITVYYGTGDYYRDLNNWMLPVKKIIHRATIAPKQKTTMRISVPKEVNGYKPKSYAITGVRYSTGEIVDR